MKDDTDRKLKMKKSKSYFESPAVNRVNIKSYSLKPLFSSISLDGF